MKSTILYSGAIILLMLFLAACDGQTDRTGTGDLADLREEMTEVVEDIDEALATNDISEFKNKTDDAISTLDNKIDEYLDDMDNADRRIDGNSRNQVIDLKQKKVEVEFKLALLEQDDYDWDNNENRENRTGTTTDPLTGTGQNTTDNLNRTTGTDTMNRTGTGQTTTNDMDRRMGNRTHREILYGPELVDDLKSDLRDLRSQVEQFAQGLPYERD